MVQRNMITPFIEGAETTIMEITCIYDAIRDGGRYLMRKDNSIFRVYTALHIY